MNRGPYALIITGTPANGEAYRAALAQAGYTTHLETTGARAQVQLAFTIPNLIVLELSLPDIPGEIILRQIRAKHRLEEVSLIVVLEDRKAAEALRQQTGLTVVSGQAKDFARQLQALGI